MKKKIIMGLLTIVGVILLDTIVAMVLNQSPILSIKKEIGNSYVKQGILIDTYFCVKDSDLVTVSWHFKTSKFACQTNKVEDIVDKTTAMSDFACDEALEEFYTDDEYHYYYPCQKNNYVVVKYTDGTEKTVKEALKEKAITIADLDEHNISYIKKEKEIDNKCLKDLLEGYITTEKVTSKEVKLSKIISTSLKKVTYSYVSKSKAGIIAIVNTTDSKVIESLDKYMDKNYKGYKKDVKNNYTIYVYNNNELEDEIIDIDSCLK